MIINKLFSMILKDFVVMRLEKDDNVFVSETYISNFVADQKPTGMYEVSDFIITSDKFLRIIVFFAL